MKKFRFVLKGLKGVWLNCEDFTVSQMEEISERYNKWYGDDWWLEYK